MRNIDGTFGQGRDRTLWLKATSTTVPTSTKAQNFCTTVHALLSSPLWSSTTLIFTVTWTTCARRLRFIPLLPVDGCLVACHDAPHVRELLTTVPIAAPIQTYGLESGAEWQAVAWHADATGTHLVVHHHGQPFGSSPVRCSGRTTSKMCCGGCHPHLGLSPTQIAAGLATYAHIKRRCEVRGVVRGITVLDDFAHHPTAVRVTEGVRQAYPGARLWAVFEPVLLRVGVPCFSTSMPRRSALPIVCSSPMSTVTENSCRPRRAFHLRRWSRRCGTRG